jgi:serine/threonine-protein kinase
MSDSSATRTPRPGWLTAARGVWIALFGLSLLIIILAIPIAYRRTIDFAAQHQSAELAQLGLSPGFEAWFLIVQQVIIAAVYFGAAWIMFRRKAHDWLVLLVALTFATWGPSTGICGCSLANELPAWRLPVFLIQAVGDGVGAIVLFLIPNGQWQPRWMRWGIIPVILWFVLSRWFSTVAMTEMVAMYRGSSILSIVIGVIALAAQVNRFRRLASPTERQQSKWINLGIAALVVGWIGNFGLSLTLSPSITSASRLLVEFASYFLFTFLPTLTLIVTVVFAMLRHRLWDIDFAINRSLVYGALTVLLLALFGVSLAVVSTVFRHLAGGPVAAVALAGVGFGAIFQPARRRCQRFVDRHFYHIEIDYQQLAPAAAPIRSGVTHVLRQTQFAAYRNLELIGRGGMAEVYKSMHPTLGQPVAIKILLDHLVIDPDFKNRFIREAQVVAGLEHANIVRVFDFGDHEGTSYMVMEYLAGHDLSALSKAKGKLSLDETVELIRQVASALDYAHQQGLVHRDIKPSNILLADGTAGHMRAVLSDFGIVKILNAETSVTQTAGLLGTFDYIAPEQIQASANLDGHADIYALGVVVYQLLTGELPFKHKHTGGLLIAHLTQPPPDPRDVRPDLPPQVATAIQRAMAKTPEQRFDTAAEFAAKLGQSEWAA